MKTLNCLTSPAVLFCLVGMSISMTAFGQTIAEPAKREKNKAFVQKTLDSNTREYGTSSNMLVRPGLLANRQKKWVKIQAEAIGTPSNSPCEFMLISEASGHDYEALLVSFAKPSDIHEALVFIGVTPGRPIDGNKYRFWPKGERVIATVDWENRGHFSARGESLLVNSAMNGPLPKDGFVFVGSTWKKPPNEPDGTNVYAADVFAPNCIASYFNDPETVLDIPRVASQGAMYDLQRPNPAYSFATGQLVNVTFEPEYRDGRKRVADLVLKVSPPAGTVTATFSNVVIRLTDTHDTSLMNGNRLQDALTVFEQIGRDGRDPFVRVEFDGDLPLALISSICKFLDAINTAQGIRIEPPPAGHAYYRAFIPEERLRDPANRAVPPWEFRFSDSSGKTGGTLTMVEDKLNRQTEKWSTVTNRFAASTPDEMRKVFDTKTEDGLQRIGPPYVFVFAPRTMPYKTAVPFIAAALATRPYVHIYLE